MKKVSNCLQNSMSTRYCQKVCLWCLEAGGGVVGAIKLIFKAIVWGPSCYVFFLSDWLVLLYFIYPLSPFLLTGWT